jgi:hypothetical protein
MKGFGRGKRRAGARPMKAAKPVAARRSPDAALGRETRGLVGPARSGPGGRSPLAAAREVGPRLRRPSLRSPGRIVTPARAAGLLGMVSAGLLLSLVTGPSAFGLARTDLPSLEWTSTEAVSGALALENGDNVFRLDTAPLEAALEALPAVAAAEVTVSLPDAVVTVDLVERRPVLAWQVGDARLIVDGTGAIFATVAVDAALPAGVAVVEDRRAGAVERYAIGGRIDAVDLDVATRLGSLTPADIGSAASRLHVVATEVDGFVVSVEGGWTAVFGFYSPATRSTEMIPGQVRLLRSLIAGIEPTISRIILASETDGTYIPKATPRPSRG